MFIVLGTLLALMAFTLAYSTSPVLLKLSPLLGILSAPLLAIETLITDQYELFLCTVLLATIWLKGIALHWLDWELEIFGDIFPFFGWTSLLCDEQGELFESADDIDPDGPIYTRSCLVLRWMIFEWTHASKTSKIQQLDLDDPE